MSSAQWEVRRAGAPGRLASHRNAHALFALISEHQRPRASHFALRTFLPALLLCWLALPCFGSPATALFQDGVQAYRAGDYAQAAMEFHESARRQPAAGTLQNLGNAEWQNAQPGRAVLAWEQALWLDPFNPIVHEDLRYARKMAQLEAPDLTWYEVVSTWLPVNWWASLAGISLWAAVGMTLVPGVLRRRRTATQQAIAALALMVFLLSIPAHLGVHTRSQLGFILEKETPLRLTPTHGGQTITRLAAGEPARYERARGDYLLIRTSRTHGWVERTQFGSLCPAPR